MTPCDAHCVHNVQVAWVSANARQQTTLLTSLFDQGKPVWKQTCGSQGEHKRQLHKLCGLAQRLITKRSLVLERLAKYWASELPGAVALRGAAGGGGDSVGVAVLSGQETVFLLAHLLDLALRNGSIGHAQVLASIHTAAVASLGAADVGGEGGAAWLPLVHMAGAIASRYQLSADEIDQALDTARALTSRAADLCASVLTATTALLHVLRTRHTAPIADCVQALVGHATAALGAGRTGLKLIAGQMALALVEAEPPGHAWLAPAAYLLAMDGDQGVRGVWAMVAEALGDSWQAAEAAEEARPFAAHGRLVGGVRPRALDERAVEECAEGFSEDDAVAVVGALVDSSRLPGHRVDQATGLGPPALACLAAVYHAVADGARRRALRLGVHEVAGLLVLLAGRRIAAAPASECLAVATHVIAAVQEAMGRSAEDAPVFWLLELLFHLCRPGRPAAALLQAEEAEDVRLLLAAAAAACSNIAFAAFVASLGVQAQYGGESGSGGARRMAECAPWGAFERLVGGCDLGDAVGHVMEAASGAAAMGSVHAALGALSLPDPLERSGRQASARLAHYNDDGEGEADRRADAYLESHGARLFLADRFLDGAISRATGRLAAPVARGMHVRGPWTPRRITGLAGLETASSADRAAPGEASRWWRAYAAGRVALAYDLRGRAADPVEALSADRRATAAVFGMAAAAEICFAQTPGVAAREAAAAWAAGDSAKAKEALLYLAFSSGGAAALDGKLAGDVLQQGSGRLRFTATGTFDAASLVMAQLMASGSEALPSLALDGPPTARAVEQLAPYVPQLLGLLNARRPQQASAALALLELLAHAAPDLLVFHAVVAARSLPAASRAARLAAGLLPRFDPEMVAAIRRFLGLAARLAVLPQERVRRACVKAKAAHDRMRRTGAAPEAFGEQAAGVRRMLAEYMAGAAPEDAVAAEFLAAVPRLRALLDRLGSKNAADEAESLWRQVFRLLATPADLAMSHVSPGLASFRFPIPLPSLTSPTAPQYLDHVGSGVHVIGSKTRPKMLALYLADARGCVQRRRYILKGSEDLRIDECAIQAFARMNRVVRSSTGCGAEGLAVYNVVPIDAYGGLIQVVDGAPSLFHLYASQPSSSADASAEHASAATGLHHVYTRHARSTLARHGLPPDLPAEKWPSAVSLATYQELLADTPLQPAMLHRHLLGVAQSASHMLWLARSFARSIGAASVAGYVLGLGDRHLDNLLVAAGEGRLVHVDFNVCFDFGSVSLVPERVPFRMTPVLQFLCGTADRGPGAFAFSRCFAEAARAMLKLARMDRRCIVRAIVRRACFRPFMEWCCIEESRLKKQQQVQQAEGQGGVEQNAVNSPLLGSPRQIPSAKDDGVLRTDEFIRENALCPPAAFWPRRPVLSSGDVGSDGDTQDAVCSVTEVPYGWRIAQEAVDRVDARLSYTGTRASDESHVPPDDDSLVAEQFDILWDAATSQDRLAKMFMGWAPWV